MKSLNYNKEYYQRNKERISKWMKEYHQRNKKPPITNICKRCGKEFISYRCNWDRFRKFCSPKCAIEYHVIQNRLNKKKYNYKLYGKDYFKKAQQKWIEKNKKKNQIKCLTTHYKKEIFDIKGRICELCKSNENLEMHHESYNIYPQRNKQQTIKRLIKNIKILCRTCHRRIHRKIN